MIKKFFLTICILSLLIFCNGCKDKNPRIFLSTKPVVKELFVPMDMFKVNDTINFVLIVPKGFKSDSVRLQLIKKNKLSPIYGDTLELGKDYNVENENYLIGAFTVYSGGRYELRFYDSDGTRKKTHFPSKAHFPRPAPVAYVQFGVE